MAPRTAVGEIACPLCERDAELHASAERTKLDPDSNNGQGRAAYPRKFFVVCPPVKGYRGCGTILANAAEAQAQLQSKGRMLAEKTSTPKPTASAEPVSQGTPPHTPAKPMPSAPEKTAPAPRTAPARISNPFKLW